MKKNNKKLITLMLAGALCCSAAIGSVMFGKSALSASAAESTYYLTDVFSATAKSADAPVIGATKLDGEEKETTTFTFANEDYVRLKRDLALKWYEGKDAAKYFTMKFAFADTNFKTMTFLMEGESSLATEKEKTTNLVKFTKGEDDKISVAVIADGTKEVDAVSHATNITANSEVTLSLARDEQGRYDAFSVLVNGENVGAFANVGSNFAEYTNEESKKVYPLQISATTEEGKSTVMYLDELNNQQFNNVVTPEGATGKKVQDTAAPVLVVNEDVNGFVYGTAFSLNYEIVDVLQTSSLSEEKYYYQYAPYDKATNYETKLTTSTYFMDTVYYTNGTNIVKNLDDIAEADKAAYKATSVYAQDGVEYVSIRFVLGDKAFDSKEETSSYQKKTYDLSWYANEEALKTIEQGEGENKTTTDFILINKSDEGAEYRYIALDNVNKKNVYVSAANENETTENYEDSKLAGQVAEYQKLLEKAASEVYAGSNAYITFPSFDWFITDNNGYRNLRFSISYKTVSSSTQTSTNLAYNKVKLSASSQGVYEFKILVHDEAGNAMKYYLNGELVEVSTSNIWDIKEIPSFSYEIKNQGMKVKDNTYDSVSDRMDTEVLDDTYNFSDVTIVGGSNQQEDYALYVVDYTAYKGEGDLEQSDLTGITYSALHNGLHAKLSEVATTYNGDYQAMYLDVYAELIANKIGGNKDEVKKCFTKVEEYNANITKDDKEWNTSNKYEWQKGGSASFATVEEGSFLIIAGYWDSLLPTVSRTAAYKLVVVESKVEQIEGDSEWLKNNLASVILFSIAGVMLVIIIILLLVKPSDETLEDVDKKAAKKKEDKQAKADKE